MVKQSTTKITKRTGITITVHIGELKPDAYLVQHIDTQMTLSEVLVVAAREQSAID